jgi:hypothetical protein
MQNFLKSFPPKDELLSQYAGQHVFDINGHIHTPYSFSAFDSIPQIFDLARQQGIGALGINDFIVTDGHAAFHEHAVKAGVFPLFNIEFMGLLLQEQENDMRVNDPSNPGRTYFSGKGLDFPSRTSLQTERQLRDVKEESNRQTREMVEKTAALLKEKGAPFTLTFEEVKSELAEDLVRERHIAKALRQKIYAHFSDDAARAGFLQQLYDGKPVAADLKQFSDTENEIRSRLLKKGGAAFVEENPNAFLAVSQIIEIILSLGGIPCYPVLLDDANGAKTEFEQNYEALHNRLQELGVPSIELIPGRNDAQVLMDFVQFFSDRNYVITFGTEHNTPDMIPLLVDTRDRKPLNDRLKEINYQGTCVLAAHQYLRAQGADGYMDENGRAKTSELADFHQLGQAVLSWFRRRD